MLTNSGRNAYICSIEDQNNSCLQYCKHKCDSISKHVILQHTITDKHTLDFYVALIAVYNVMQYVR
jgi:hypothetical protein